MKGLNLYFTLILLSYATYSHAQHAMQEVHLLINGTPISDLKGGISPTTRGAMNILIEDPGNTSTLSFGIILVRDNKPLKQAINVDNLDKLRAIKLEELLTTAKDGDRLIVQINGYYPEPIYYKIPIKGS